MVFFVIFMCSWVTGIYSPLCPHGHCNKLFLGYILLKINLTKLYTCTAVQRKKKKKGWAGLWNTINFKVKISLKNITKTTKTSKFHKVIVVLHYFLLQIPMERRNISQNSAQVLQRATNCLHRPEISYRYPWHQSTSFSLRNESLYFHLVVIERFSSSTLKQSHCC